MVLRRGVRRSFPKIDVTCFSTARSVTTSSSATARFERPSAISPSTSRSRGVSSSSGSSARLRLEHVRHHLGVERGPAVGHARHRVGEQLHVGHAVLQQVADAVAALGQQVDRVALLDVLGEDEHALSTAAPRAAPAPPGARRRCSSAACGCRSPRRPACGRAPCASGRRRRRPGRPPRSPASSSSRTMPSRIRTESSATTTRMGSPLSRLVPSPGGLTTRQDAVERRDPVGQAAQPGARSPGRPRRRRRRAPRPSRCRRRARCAPTRSTPRHSAPRSSAPRRPRSRRPPRPAAGSRSVSVARHLDRHGRASRRRPSAPSRGRGR